MANEPIVAAPVAVAPVSAPVAPVEVAQVAPAPAATVVAPVTETPVAPVVAPAAAGSEAPKAVEAKAPETLLGDTKDKPVEAPKTPEAVVEAPKVEEKTKEGQSADPAPPPVYDAFTVPEGVTLDTARVSEFTKSLAELEQSGKVPHELLQKFGQTAVDMYVTEVKKATDALTQTYVKAWEDQKIAWKDSFLKDPEIGGNRWQTTIDSAQGFIRTHGGTTEQQTEFRSLMESSGLGNHPVMIRLLANANRTMAEGKQLAASKPAPVQKSKVETMYGKSA